MIGAPVAFFLQYERTHPVYNYELDNCGAMYITIGDGGNIEGPYR
jgi:hypothetical protein